MFILKFHYHVGHQGLEIDPCIKFHFPQSFSLSVTCTYICQSKCIGRDCFVFREIHNFNHDYVCRVTELYLSNKFYVCQCYS